jgi:hypothetical protein
MVFLYSGSIGSKKYAKFYFSIHVFLPKTISNYKTYNTVNITVFY